MQFLLWLLLIVPGVVVIAYLTLLVDWFLTGGRMTPSYASFGHTTLRSEGKVRALVVYLPGILARAEQQVTPITGAFLEGLPGKQVDLLTVDYRGEMFSWSTISRLVCEEVMSVERQYDEIMFVGASLGGRLLNAIYHQLREEPVEVKLRRPIIIDAPMNRHGFAQGGDILALILRFMPIGRLINRLRLHEVKLGLPEDVNIGNAADFVQVSGDPTVNTYRKYIAWVKQRAVKGLSGHPFSVWRDQLVAIDIMPWYDDAFEGYPPLYIVNSEKSVGYGWHIFTEETKEEVSQDGSLPLRRPVNNTLRQLDSFAAWRERTLISDLWVVRSTHCGFLERPVAWHQAFAEAVAKVSPSGVRE